MYSEKTFKNYIFWTQIRRIVVIILLSCLGASIGILVTKILESTVKVTTFNNIIIIVSTVIFFLISLLLTVGTGKQVQDGYWKIAVLRKLTVIQKNLELNNQLLKNTGKTVRERYNVFDENEENEDILKIKKEHKKKAIKTIKKPEELSE